MQTWNALRERIALKTLDSPTWQSDYKSLLYIIEAAEEFGIDPGDAKNASISNLRTIIRVAKDAIELQDQEELSKLFNLASNLTTGELRVKIGVHAREEVTYEEIDENGIAVYRITLTGKQFELLKKATKNRIKYNRST